MKTYWDHTEKERAAMTEADVQRFADVELMTKGVLRVPALELEPEPTLPEPDMDTFSVSCAGAGRMDAVFTSAEDARKFVALGAKGRSYHYLANEFFYFVDPDTEWKITAERAYSKNAADTHKHAFAAAKDARRRNESAKDAHEKALKTQQEALSDMWSDWHDCGRKALANARVRDTLESYKALAEGDITVAFRFLRKAIPDSQIVDALDWFGLEPPSEFYVRGVHIFEHDKAEAMPAGA